MLLIFLCLYESLQDFPDKNRVFTELRNLGTLDNSAYYSRNWRILIKGWILRKLYVKINLEFSFCDTCGQSINPH